MPSSQSEEPLTDELLKKLRSSLSADQYLSTTPLHDLALSDYLNELLDKKGLTKSAVIRASGLGGTYVYQLFSGERSKPSRNLVIMLAFGLSCDLTEAQRLLRHAGMSELYCKRTRDAIIIYCLDHGWSREQCDDELFRRGLPTLLSED